MAKIRFRIAAASAALILLTAGVWPFGVWSGFRKPEPTDYQRAETSAPCPAVGLQNLTPERRAMFLAALADVCEILADPEFSRRVQNEPEWLADCLSNGMPGRGASGAEVVQALTPPRYGFSVVAGKPWGADAVTNLYHQGIAIRKQRFDAWASGVPARQAAMINTLAHEMTHLVPESPGSMRSLFKDEDHVASNAEADRHKCLNSKLVSYDVGRIVAEIWLERQAARPAGS